MRLATEGQSGREGMRMGLWGAAQAIAFAVGGLVGTGAVDLARALISAPAPAYAAVFAFEALLFVMSARLAGGVEPRAHALGRTDGAARSGATAASMP